MKYVITLLVLGTPTLPAMASEYDVMAKAAWAWTDTNCCSEKASVKKCTCDCEVTRVCTCGDNCACPACDAQSKAGIPFTRPSVSYTQPRYSYTPSYAPVYTPSYAPYQAPSFAPAPTASFGGGFSRGFGGGFARPASMGAAHCGPSG